MKRFIPSLMLAAIAACPLAGFAQADIKNDPGYLPIDKYLDVKAIPPQVDVNLPGFLLKDALSGMNITKPGDSAADLQDLVKDVKLIRVLVFEGTKSNRAALAKAMKPLQAELDDKWTTLARAKDEGDNVGVFIKGEASGDLVAGLAVLVHDGGDGDTVIVNVVGHVPPGKLMKFASQSGQLTQDLLKQLGIAGGMSSDYGVGYSAGYGGGYGGGYGVGYGGAAVTSKMKTTDNDAGTKKPVGAPKSAAKDAVTK